MQSIAAISDDLTSFIAFILLVLAFYVTSSGHSGSSPKRVEFIICGLLLTIYLCGIILPFFGKGLTMFGLLGFVVVLTGGVIGGVFGVLLPRLSAGISLGVLLSLLVCVILDTVDNVPFFLSTSLFATLIPLCTFSVYQLEPILVPMRSGLACGLLTAVTISIYTGEELLNIICNIFDGSVGTTRTPISMVIIWLVVSIISFVIQSHLNGNMKTWRSGERYTPLVQSSTELKAKASEQKTFSYPDTLEYNYFDPDNLPRIFQPHADIIFTTVQYLASEMGFQVDNSRNQAEHLLMMLSNECKTGEHILIEAPNRLHDRLFANYKKWCDRVGAQPMFSRRIAGKAHIALIEDIFMFLLIWGEAANLRHCPELLCFLYHKTMTEHQDGSCHSRFPKEHLYPGHFLDHVITPMYEVMAAAVRSKGDHESRKTYDDFNEFFWSPSSLKYEIIHTDIDSDIIVEGKAPNIHVAHAMASAKKTYVEKRSYFHAILSFHRVLEWHSVAFVLLAVIGTANDLVWTTAYTLQVASIVFIQINMFQIIWICLEVWSSYPSSAISSPAICGYLLRLGSSYILLLFQAIYFYWSFDEEPQGDLVGDLRAAGNANFWWWQYVWLSLLTLVVYFTECIVCWFPSITSSLLCWNNDYIQALLNICYPLSQIYVGKKIHVGQLKVLRYIFFWVTLISWKLYFGYTFISNPITVPTIELYDDYMNLLDVSFAKTVILMAIWWIPHYLVFLIDLSIWYSVWSAFVGAFAALFLRMGAVRDTYSLRTHFMRAPHALCQRLMPPSSSVGVRGSRGAPSKQDIQEIEAQVPDEKKKHITKVIKYRSSSNDLATFQQGGGLTSEEKDSAVIIKIEGSERMGEFLDVRTQRWVVFSRIWNAFMTSLRDADHISNAEFDMYRFSLFEWLSKPVYLPLFQTAGCVEQALVAYTECSAAYLSEIKPHLKVLIWDNFNTSLGVATKEAVSETWELTCWFLEKLLGPVHLQDMTAALRTIGRWAGSDDIYCKFNASSLQGIVDQISVIVGILKGCVAKRKHSPLVTPDIHKKFQAQSKETKVTTGFDAPVKHTESHSHGFKKSVSTGFLSGLQAEQQNDKALSLPSGSSTITKKNKFAKLEPFKTTVILDDSTRDKLRDEMRILFSTLKNALKDVTAPIGSDSKQILDSLSFLMVMENGFFWDDVYGSVQIDEFALDTNVPAVLSKLHGLLKLRHTQVELSSMEARRRINFFINSLFMDMPVAPSLRYSKEYTVMTPFYSEDVLLTRNDLEQQNEDGVTTLLYLQTLYKKDWQNFLERNNLKDDQLIWNSTNLQATRMWASLRAQTLFRTVDGMMQSEAAIRLLGELEQLSKPDIDIFAKLKFSYVVACQVYGQMKKNLEHKADDIDFLLARFPNLRIAYIDVIRVNREGDMAYYSVLIKNDPSSILPPAPKGNKVREVFRVKLPGNPVLGEGKPENQNHAIIFTRGRFLQAIDMNQDGYVEESLKMRNLLEEFEDGYSILGFREHIFTGSVSSVANYMALQELSFVSLGQRVLTDPLNIRQHYGHPDVFDKIFVMTEGGMSKASKGINLSEDVFAGFNATIRGHSIGFKEYIQVGKGRDIGLQQTYKFEAKLAQGNAEQTLSRDMYRICERLDFFRLMSFYYGGVGHYVANALIMFTLTILVYFMVGLAIFDQEGVNGRPMAPEGPIQLALAGMGLLQTMPLIMTLVVEKGVMGACREIGYMFLSGGPLYFIFQIQTKSYFFQQTILAGGASYKATGRGFVTRHSPFDENYRFFASSHIYLGFELIVALILFKLHSVTHQYLGLTWSLWLVAISFIFGPFWFNPMSFETTKVAEDYTKWMIWMNETGGSVDQSWVSWFKEENAYISKLTVSWKVFLLITRCTMWTIMGIGIAGPAFTTSGTEIEKFAAVFVIFMIFYFGNWCINKLESSLSYSFRRCSSLLLSFSCLGLLVYLFHAHKKYFMYSVASYYIGSSVSFASLLFAIGDSSYLYKIHDYVVGHLLFIVMYVLSILQLGILQTWLLYHNALSAGVAIDSILRYASRKKEGEADETAINELRSQVADQEHTIHQLLSHMRLESVELTERSGLLGKAEGKSYGSSNVRDDTSVRPATLGFPAPTAAISGKAPPKPALKSSLHSSPSSEALAPKAEVKLACSDDSSGEFIFKQPEKLPARF